MLVLVRWAQFKFQATMGSVAEEGRLHERSVPKLNAPRFEKRRDRVTCSESVQCAGWHLWDVESGDVDELDGDILAGMRGSDHDFHASRQLRTSLTHWPCCNASTAPMGAVTYGELARALLTFAAREIAAWDVLAGQRWRAGSSPFSNFEIYS